VSVLETCLPETIITGLARAFEVKWFVYNEKSREMDFPDMQFSTKKRLRFDSAIQLSDRHRGGTPRGDPPLCMAILDHRISGFYGKSEEQ
jgi:hypothetical protein